MTGIDKITARIREDTAAEKDKILASAAAHCKRLRAEAETGAAKASAESAKRTEKQVALLLATNDSAAHRDGRNLLLSTRRELMERAFAESLARLNGLEGAALFEVLERVVAANAQPGEGLLLLSEKNAAAMPSDFLARCNAKITNGCVKLGDERRAVDGAVLKYGDVEINCAFSEMLSATREQLEDEVNHTLFA